MDSFGTTEENVAVDKRNIRYDRSLAMAVLECVGTSLRAPEAMIFET
jgi:hypothetical protein